MTETILKPTAVQEKADREPKPLRVCFVCTGNTCRSPMAEALANAMAKEAGRSIEAFSAGLFASGEPMAKNAILALSNAKIPEVHPYRLHLSHSLTEKEAKSYDRLIGVTHRHALELFFRFPALVDKIVSLPHDVADPFGGDLAVYTACLEQLKQEIAELLFPEVAK